MLSGETMREIEDADWFGRTTRPYLVVDADLRIRAVNRRYEEVTAHPRSMLIGEGLFDVFPDNPADPRADGVANLSASIERVFSTGEWHPMGIQRYDVRDLSDPRRFVQKVWAPANFPLRRDGRTVAVLHHAEDVTALARLTEDSRVAEQLDLFGLSQRLWHEFPVLGLSAVVGAVAHSHQLVLQALDGPHLAYAEMLARTRVEQLARDPQATPHRGGGDAGGPGGRGGWRLVHNGLELLDEPECLRLLASQNVGRVAVSIGALPAIFPVNYRVSGNAVYFRTGEGTKLSSALSHSVVAFEVDSVDPVHHSGWSVQVIGRARVASDTDPFELVQPWADGTRDRLVEIEIEMITGRRIDRGVPEA